MIFVITILTVGLRAQMIYLASLAESIVIREQMNGVGWIKLRI